MKKIIILAFSLSLGCASLISCTNTEVGTATGAAAGAGLGYAVSGNGWGSAIGAGAGALIGNSIGKEQDRRYYQNRYYRY
jgi:osmotically inducible lipoprotein OsmB